MSVSICKCNRFTKITFLHRPERNNILVKSCSASFLNTSLPRRLFTGVKPNSCELYGTEFQRNFHKHTHTLHIKLSHVNQFSFFHIFKNKHAYIQVILLSGLCIETISQIINDNWNVRICILIEIRIENTKAKIKKYNVC